MKHIYSFVIAVLFIASNNYTMQPMLQSMQFEREGERLANAAPGQDLIDNLPYVPLTQEESDALTARNQRAKSDLVQAIKRNHHKIVSDEALEHLVTMASDRCCQKDAHILRQELKRRRQERERIAHPHNFDNSRRVLNFDEAVENE